MIWQMDSLLILSVRMADGENVQNGTSGRGQSKGALDIESVCIVYFFIYLLSHKRKRSTHPFFATGPQDIRFYTVR